MGQATPQDTIRTIDSGLMLKVLYAFTVLVLLSAVISIGGKWFGASIVMAGHSDSTRVHEIVIGNNVLAVRANMIRFERARRDGIAARVDLYMRWPDMEGYSAEARDDFNNVGGAKRILFVSIEEQTMSRDMSGRFAPIYSSLIAQSGKPGPAGTIFHEFSEKSGYLNEVLVVATRAGKDPFVARCLTGANAADSLAPCERDIHIGDHLSLIYRFPKELLGEWQALEASMAKKAAALLKTGKER
ncbi:hypothetical protein EET67_06020 [Pseudaminobacter arsenicus]|uniref:Uncharacterized protein n=1 Tax=Borborobacter arsenicus TaxID=1851146 RepID=A0A432V937_9HYPH|nr:hypothetical protein [Pseudaminobacter arsenicus]RUM98659.1 hypothetical protein EET67_06020 [Pseudaminobacter arsenicus]